MAQVGALQDVRSELTKLRGVLFYKILEDLHAHLYNKGEYRYLFLHSYLLEHTVIYWGMFCFLQRHLEYMLLKCNFNCGLSVLHIFPLTSYSHANFEALLCLVNLSSILFAFVSTRFNITALKCTANFWSVCQFHEVVKFIYFVNWWICIWAVMCAALQAQRCWRMMTMFSPPLMLHLLHIVLNLGLEEQSHSKVTIKLASRLMGNTGQMNFWLFLLFSS